MNSSYIYIYIISIVFVLFFVPFVVLIAHYDCSQLKGHQLYNIGLTKMGRKTK